jgi:uncharacterized membrane protein
MRAARRNIEIPVEQSERRGNRAFLGRILFGFFTASSLAFSVPFLKDGPFLWADKNLYLQGMVLSLTVALFTQSLLSLKPRNTRLLFFVSFCVSYLAEVAGIRWAWPFSSRYHYHPSILPQLPGGVPLCIPLMWFMLAFTTLIFLRPVSIRTAGRISMKRLLLKAAGCALYVTATDFVIDPLGVLFKAWTWDVSGMYFGIPFGNFMGWFGVGFVICGVYLLFESPPPEERFRLHVARDGAFAAASVFLTCVCFAGSVMHTDSVLPAAVSLSVMGPFWIYWAISAWRVRRETPNS